jgi:hypothetical protein
MLSWTKIADKLPEEKKPVFLIKNVEDDIENADGLLAAGQSLSFLSFFYSVGYAEFFVN